MSNNSDIDYFSNTWTPQQRLWWREEMAPVAGGLMIALCTCAHIVYCILQIHFSPSTYSLYNHSTKVSWTSRIDLHLFVSDVFMFYFLPYIFLFFILFILLYLLMHSRHVSEVTSFPTLHPFMVKVGMPFFGNDERLT